MKRSDLGYNEFYTGEVTHKSTMDIAPARIPSRAITLEEYLAKGGLPLVSNRAVPDEALAAVRRTQPETPAATDPANNPEGPNN